MTTPWQVKSEFYLDQFITVQAVELAWIWIKERHTKEHMEASAQAFKERLEELEKIMLERVRKEGK